MARFEGRYLSGKPSDRRYDLAGAAEFFRCLFESGVMALGDNLRVEAAGAHTVQIHPGKALLDGYLVKITAEGEEPYLMQAPQGGKRGRVVLRAEKSGPGLYVKEGTAQDAPELERTAEVYEISLASIWEADGLIVVADERADEALCGVCELKGWQERLASPSQYTLTASADAQLLAPDPFGNTAIVSEANLDTGSFEVGRDYRVFASMENGESAYIVSQNQECGAAHLIGGFHYGKCRRVNQAMVPTNEAGVPRGTNWEANVYDGIVPRSVWTLTHRPKCNPEGMVYLGSGVWVDIYLASDDGAGSLASRYNKKPLTGTEGLNWYDFNERALSCGKRLLSYGEWQQMAFGSPGGNANDNLNAWSAVANRGRNNTGLVSRAVSSVGCMDAVGNLWEWTAEFVTRAQHQVITGNGAFPASDGARGGKIYTNGNGHGTSGAWAWDSVSPFPDGQGNIFEYNDYSLSTLLAGSYWPDGARAGVRSVLLSDAPWATNSSVGARCACDSI